MINYYSTTCILQSVYLIIFISEGINMRKPVPQKTLIDHSSKGFEELVFYNFLKHFQ